MIKKTMLLLIEFWSILDENKKYLTDNIRGEDNVPKVKTKIFFRPD